ncbi:MAG: acyl carrier protein [Eubacteriaceae bacterium]|nr:acyl carrier protein [Eubacteriaceae bacterium]
MDMEQKVKTIIAEQLEVDREMLSDNTSFIDDLGADSIDLLELVLAFEDEFDVTFDEEDVKCIKTVGDIVEYIENKK